MPTSPSDLPELRVRAAARARSADLRGRTDLGGFIEHVSPPLVRPTHLAPLLDLLDVSMSRQVFGLVSTPPRHGKTIALLHAAVRLLRWHPDRIVAFASYETGIAQRKSRLARDIAQRAGIVLRAKQASGPRLWDPSASVSFWQTPQGGGFLATGRGGALTGEGIDLLLIDDPFKNRDEVESSLIRDKAWDWLTGVAFQRLEPGGSAVICQQRWHADDMIGRAQQQAEQEFAAPWQTINLPAVAEDGSPLWPARYDRAALQRIRATIGEYNWWAQFQGRPRPRGAQVFGEPVHWDLARRAGSIIISADAASTEDTRADHSVAVVGCYWRETDGMLRCDVLDAWRGQVEVPRFVAELRRLQALYPTAPLVVEAQGGEGRAVVQVLRSMDRALRIVGVPTTSDKFARAQAVAAAWNQGRVRLPPEAPWLADFVRVVTGFTGVRDRHDDDVDALSVGWNHAVRVVAGRLGVVRSLPRRTAMAASTF